MTPHELDAQRNLQLRILDEQKATRAELVALRRLFDHCAGVLLNAKFPHGKPCDRWARR